MKFYIVIIGYLSVYLSISVFVRSTINEAKKDTNWHFTIQLHEAFYSRILFRYANNVVLFLLFIATS